MVCPVAYNSHQLILYCIKFLFLHLFYDHIMYSPQMISKILFLLSQMFFQAVLLTSNCHNCIQANGISTATILCNFNIPSLFLVFIVHHISPYMHWNICSCLCMSSFTYRTPHPTQLSCFIRPDALLPVTIFRHNSIQMKSTYCPVMSIHLSAHTTVAPTRQIYMKYDIGDFSQNLSRQLKFGYNEAKTSSTIHEETGTFYCSRCH